MVTAKISKMLQSSEKHQIINNRKGRRLYMSENSLMFDSVIRNAALRENSHPTEADTDLASQLIRDN